MQGKTRLNRKNSETFKPSIKQNKIMGKVIQIEVPEEVVEVLEKNPKLKEAITKEIINKISYEEMQKGKISKDLLNLLVGEKDVVFEDEEEILKELREKAKSRLE